MASMNFLKLLLLAAVVALATPGCQSDTPAAQGKYATHDRGVIYNGSGYGRWAP
jgi:hypothetical protein